jgi:signal transduction histidine kinase
VSAPRNSVRRKLLGMILAATAAALLVAIGAMVAYDLYLYRQSWINDLRTQADLLGRTSTAALTFDDSRSAQENLELLRYRPRIRAAVIYDARGRRFASFAQAPGEPFPRLPESDGTRVEGSDIVVFKRVSDDREILGTVYLRADYDLYPRFAAYLGIAAVVMALAMAVALLLSRRLQEGVVRPLLALSALAGEVSERRNFALRAEVRSDDEIGQLAGSLNGMLADIERATRELETSSAEVRRLNEELEMRVKERTRQLEYTNAELEAFCYSVSHDLRAPLRAIDGFSQALLEDFPHDVPEDAKGYLARIRSSTQRMGQLIEDLLNLSKVSRAELQRREVDLGQIAQEVLAELRQRDPGRAVEVLVWDNLKANADGRLMRAALENLIGNAWKFSSRTAAPRIEVGAMRDGAQATFFIRDNGAGFDMKYANKLFGAFQRLHGANEFQGTGIGLATVQRIVHRHGGRIWAEATPGKGAVFYFTLGLTTEKPS